MSASPINSQLVHDLQVLQKHRARQARYQRKYYNENKEKCKEYVKKHYESHKEARRVYGREYYYRKKAQREAEAEAQMSLLSKNESEPQTGQTSGSS